MLAPVARIRPDWPGPARPAADTAKVAHQFETLIAEMLLKSARAASLGDESLGEDSGGSGDQVRAMVDHARAEAIARAAPLGIARLLKDAK